MSRYTVDGVAMVHYLLDTLPPAADDVFMRAEQGIDVLEAPTVAISEAIWAAVRKGDGGKGHETTPNAILHGLVHDGPVDVAPTDEHDLAVFGSLIDHHTLHDALLIANHRVRGTEAIVSSDAGIEGEATVWE
jgi:predicted nucleic acid-binding protein